MAAMATLKTEIDPADVGFDGARLEILDRHFQRYVDDGLLAGWLLAVSRHGQLAHVSTYGQRDVEAGLPVETDTIWRIYSMTKPITAVAALVAYEQGLFELNDPVRWYIPSFADTKVWRSGSFTAPVLEPITEELRVWQLFAHTSGLTYGFMQNHPVDALYRQAGFEWGTPTDATDLAGICDHLAALPLVFQPGTEWQYSMGLDVLGRVIEVVAGVPFDEFLQTHVLDPLGMTDTVWHVDEGRADRLAALYAPTPGSKQAFRYDAMGGARHDTAGGPARRRWAVRHGRRLRPLRRDAAQPRRARRRAHPRPEDGRADGQQPPARRRRPHAPSAARCSPRPRSTASASASASASTIDPVKARVPGSVGDFGWGGAASTSYWVDPVEDLSVVWMTQLLPSSTHPLRSQLKQLVHAALVAPER